MTRHSMKYHPMKRLPVSPPVELEIGYAFRAEIDGTVLEEHVDREGRRVIDRILWTGVSLVPDSDARPAE